MESFETLHAKIKAIRAKKPDTGYDEFVARKNEINGLIESAGWTQDEYYDAAFESLDSDPFPF
jgi:hypothetical protein